MKIISLSFLAISIYLSTAAFGDQYEVCKTPIIHAAVQNFEQFSRKDVESFYYESKCGSHKSESNQEQNLVVNAVIDSLPSGLSFGSSSNNSTSAQWCNENIQHKRDNSFYYKKYTTIFGPALTSFNSCVAAMNSRLVVSLNQLTQDRLYVRIRNADSHSGHIQGVGIHPIEASHCSASYNDKIIENVNGLTNIPFDIGMTVTFDCVRKKDTGLIYPETSFTFRNDIGEVTYVMAKYDLNTYTKDVPPEKHLLVMHDVIVAATAYWAGQPPGSTVKGTYFVKQCNSEPAGSTFVGSKETTLVQHQVPYCLNNSDFDGRQPCLGSDENCTVTKANGCYVSNDWLDWYKRSIREDGLTYSESQICSK